MTGDALLATAACCSRPDGAELAAPPQASEQAEKAVRGGVTSLRSQTRHGVLDNDPDYE